MEAGVRELKQHRKQLPRRFANWQSSSGGTGIAFRLTRVGLAGGSNLYTYVGNNPLRFIDPLGLWSEGTMPGDIAPIMGDTIGWMLDKINPPPVTASPQPTNHPRCKDYNGPYGNGSNLPSYDPRGIASYIGSDCHMAQSNPDIPMCATDHMNGGCAANHGGQICSIYLH